MLLEVWTCELHAKTHTQEEIFKFDTASRMHNLHAHAGRVSGCSYPSQGVRGRENDPGYKGSNPCCYGLKATIQRIHSGAVSFRNELNHVRFHHSVHWGERHGSHSEPYEHLPLLTYSKEQIERYKLAETAHQYDCLQKFTSLISVIPHP